MMLTTARSMRGPTWQGPLENVSSEGELFYNHYKLVLTFVYFLGWC